MSRGGLRDADSVLLRCSSSAAEHQQLGVLSSEQSQARSAAIKKELRAEKSRG